jgi:hypothetical protein
VTKFNRLSLLDIDTNTCAKHHSAYVYSYPSETVYTSTFVAISFISLVMPVTVSFVRFQVITAASMKMAVFWVAPCGLVEVD